MHKLYASLFLIIIGSALSIVPVQAQDSGRVQQLTGELGTGELAYYVLPDLHRGERLYIYISTTAGNLDPMAALIAGDANLQALWDQYRADFETVNRQSQDPFTALADLRDRYSLAWDDDSGSGYAASFEFVVPQDGDYGLLVGGTFSLLGIQSFGEYRLWIGIDAPQVLTGDALDTGDKIAFLDQSVLRRPPDVQQVQGEISASEVSQVYDLRTFQPGDTLYVFVETISGDLKPALILMDFGEKPIRSANTSGQENQAVLEFSFKEISHNYKLQIYGCCGLDRATTGEYRLLVGINNPNVLDGNAPVSGSTLLLEPVQVKTGVKLQQITEINQQNEVMGIVATIQMNWNDPALAFSPDVCECMFKVFNNDNFDAFIDLANGVWPEFTLYNQQGRRFTQNRDVVVQPNGDVIYLERFSADLQVDFDFTQYPFDRQEFIIRIDMIYPERYYVFADLEGYSEISPEHGEDEFVITDFETQISSVKSSTLSSNSRYTFRFQAPRHPEYYIFQIFIPVGLIMLVSWVTFFLKDYSRRIEVATGNLLLFIAFSFSIADNYPRLGYLTFLDVFMAFTFVTNALVVMYNVYLRRLEMQGREEHAEKIDTYLDWLYPSSFCLTILIIIWFFFGK